LSFCGHDVLIILDISVGDFLPRDRLRGGDGGVDFLLDGGELFGSERCGGEVEAEAIRGHEGTLLSRICGDHFVQCPVEQVRSGVMGLDGTTTVVEDSEDDFVAHLELSLRWDEVTTSVADLLHAGDEVFGIAVFVQHFAFVALLATHLGIEGGLVGDREEFVFDFVELENSGFAFVVVETYKACGCLRLKIEGGDGF